MVATDEERGPWIPLAEVARPHGVRGELRLKLYNSDSDALLEQDEVLVRLPPDENGAVEEHEVSVDFARRADQAILMKLYTIDDRDRADELRGAQICVRRGDFPPLDEGEFYACDVVGARVLVDGAEIGAVRELRTYPSVDALIVKADDGGRDWEIPLVEAFIGKVDVDAQRVELVTLEGLER